MEQYHITEVTKPMIREVKKTAVQKAADNAPARTELRAAIKKEAQSAAKQIMGELQRGAMKSVKRITKLVDSNDEQVAFKASSFVIDHIIGKATQKSISRVENVTIDVLAD